MSVLPTRARSSAALVLAGVLWGTGGLAGSLLGRLAGLHPLAVADYRLLVGGGVATLFVVLKGGALPRTAEAAKRLLAVGGLFALFQASYFAAVAFSSVSIATMTTIGAAPVVVTLAGRRKPGRWTVVSLAGTIAGLVLLRWSPDEPAHLAGGLGFALLAAAGFAALTLLTAKPVEGLEPLSTTAFGCLAGGVLLTPVASWSGMALPLHADVLAVACYLGTVPTALAYAAYLRGLTTAHPVLGALSAVLEPLTAAVLSALLFGERLSATAWCGAAVLVAALAVGYWRPEPR
ncbi:DMT family transporter [Amycolatopsis australiensis]|uniref:Drug/metabolite transporter, DME family n=1 Tax=Amycolatopsis australiensis TaxID=546364 RepID=A0A1K1T136_9PSEU|nr:EamA family transporter [Amycolatopsis australiensis]SFW90282.1 drug/metabolite transporter, DME family [Amycolatopsis australiensis]